MLRLVFEAVMVVAVISCLYFLIKLGDNKPDLLTDQDDDSPKV